MIEIRHPVDSVVAIQAVSPKEFNVLIHEYSIISGMAGYTGTQLKTLHIIQMTGQAGQGLFGIIPVVTHQAETGL